MPVPSPAGRPAVLALVLGAALSAVACTDRATRTPAPPTATPSPVATATPIASATATATATPPPHELSIEFLRRKAHPGGPLTVVRELGAKGNYTQSVVRYPSDGLAIQALLTVPQGDPPPTGWPAVIFNHGYIPPAQYRTTERYVAYVDAFARNGYVVLKSDYRGHGESEGEPSGGYGNQGYTSDVLNGLASLRARPDVDPDRIGMWGHSMGGWITLRSMVTTDTVKAGVIWAGVVASYPDLLTRWRRPGAPTQPAATTAGGLSASSSAGRRWRTDLVARFGEPEANPAAWAPLSANTYLADLSGPIELHHGTADSSVPFAFSETLVEEIEAVGGNVALFTYPGDDHNISANLSTALARSVAFFDANVKDVAP